MPGGPRLSPTIPERQYHLILALPQDTMDNPYQPVFPIPGKINHRVIPPSPANSDRCTRASV